jgi:hypothetical protein
MEQILISYSVYAAFIYGLTVLVKSSYCRLLPSRFIFPRWISSTLSTNCLHSTFPIVASILPLHRLVYWPCSQSTQFFPPSTISRSDFFYQKVSFLCSCPSTFENPAFFQVLAQIILLPWIFHTSPILAPTEREKIMLEFKWKKIEVKNQTKCCHQLKMLELGLIDRMYLFHKSLLTIHMPYHKRNNNYSTEKRERDNMQKSQTLTK